MSKHNEYWRCGLVVLLAAASVIGLDAQEYAWKAGTDPVVIDAWSYTEHLAASVAASFDVDATAASAERKPYDGGYLSRSDEAGPRVYIFQADVSFDPAADRNLLGLYLGPGDYPRDVYLNGVRLLATGDPSVPGQLGPDTPKRRYNGTVYYASRVPLPPELLAPPGTPDRIAIVARPLYETSPLGDVQIGDYYDVSRAVFFRNFFNISLVQASAVVAIIIALFLFFLFAWTPVRDYRYLYAALMCVAYAFGYSNMSLYNDAADSDLLEKFSRVGLTLTSMLLGLFAMEFTGIGRGKRWPRVAFAVPGILAAIGVATQEGKQAIQGFFTTVTTNFYLTPALLATLAVFIVGFRRKPSAARGAVMFGFFTAVAASLHDIYFITTHQVPFCYLVAYGYLTLLVSIFFVLALEQASLSAQLAERSRALDTRNSTLAEMVRGITEVSDGLVASSIRLDTAIQSALREVTEFGDESARISEEFRTQTQRMDKEISLIAVAMEDSARKVGTALDSQTEAVTTMSATLEEIRSQIEDNLARASESSRIAGVLSEDAVSSAASIEKSRESMVQAAAHSSALEGVLASIEDIAARTHVLSINAAIESARLGAQGRGFSVIAQEIRTLSDQSSASLQSSLEKVGHMTEAVQRGTDLSIRAADTLRSIAEGARSSAERTEEIRSLIERQRTQGEDMMRRAGELLSEAKLLQALSEEERRSSTERQEAFKAIGAVLDSIASRLGEQDSRRRSMLEALDTMREVMTENGRRLENLKKSVHAV